MHLNWTAELVDYKGMYKDRRTYYIVVSVNNRRVYSREVSRENAMFYEPDHLAALTLEELFEKVLDDD